MLSSVPPRTCYIQPASEYKNRQHLIIIVWGELQDFFEALQRLEGSGAMHHKHSNGVPSRLVIAQGFSGCTACMSSVGSGFFLQLTDWQRRIISNVRILGRAQRSLRSLCNFRLLPNWCRRRAPEPAKVTRMMFLMCPSACTAWGQWFGAPTVSGGAADDNDCRKPRRYE